MIYLDAGIIIRMIEGNEAARVPLVERLAHARRPGAFLLTSRLSRLECRCKPLQIGNFELLELYESFFSAPELLVREIDATIVEKATELRAGLGLKTPDAIHAATAWVSEVEEFWTADQDFVRLSQLRVTLFATS
jgi:predicted nucleic acid-binding protein